MADAFTDANSTVDESKRRLLEAIAQGGTAGRTQFEQTQAALQAQKQAAIAAALSEGALRGAPEAMRQLTAQQVGGSFDRRLTDLTAAQGDLERRLADQRASGESYFAQAQGAIPVIRAQAERELALAREKAAEDAAKRSGADISPLNALSKQLGGIANTNKYLLDQSENYVKDALKGGVFLPGSAELQTAQDKARARFDAEFDLPPGYTSALSKSTKAKPKTAAQQTSHLRSLPQYKKIWNDAQASAAAVGTKNKAGQKITKAQVRAALIAEYGRSNPNTLKQVLRDMGL